MARTEIGKYFAIDTRVCGGRVIFKGSRIMVSDAVELNRAGYTPDQITYQYRSIITPEAVKEVLLLVQQGLIKDVEAGEKAVV